MTAAEKAQKKGLKRKQRAKESQKKVLERRARLRAKAKVEREEALKEKAARAPLNRELVTVRNDRYPVGSTPEDRLKHNMEVLKVLQDKYFEEHPEEYEQYLKEVAEQEQKIAAESGSRNIGGSAEVAFRPNPPAGSIFEDREAGFAPSLADGKTGPENG